MEANIRVANSHYTAARIKAVHPKIGKIDVCHLALGSTMSPGESEIDRPATKAETELLGQIRRSSVLIVGRMMQAERYKGHDQLIQAWPAITREVPDAQLIVVGQGDDVARLKRACARAGSLLEAVVFCGSRD